MVSEPRRPVSDDMPDQFWDSLVHSVACDELTRGILALVQTESQAKVLVVVATLARTHTLKEATMSSYQKPVKARLARVNCCAECPFGWYAENDKEFACNSMVDADGAERLAGPGDTIPDWCPLPEAEEATDAG